MRVWDPRKNPLLIPSSIGMPSPRRSSEPSRRPTHPLRPSGVSPSWRPPTPTAPISDPRAAVCPIGGGPPPPRQEAAPPMGCPLLLEMGFGVSLPVLAEVGDQTLAISLLFWSFEYGYDMRIYRKSLTQNLDKSWIFGVGRITTPLPPTVSESAS